MVFITGSILTSIGLVVCAASAVLVALAFILYYAVTRSSRAKSDSHIWDPQESGRRGFNRQRAAPPARFGGIPSTGSSRRTGGKDAEDDPDIRE